MTGRMFTAYEEPPIGEHIEMMTPHDGVIVWNGKRWRPEDMPDQLQCYEAWPPDVPGPYWEVES